MAILEILQFPNPLLAKKADVIKRVERGPLFTFADDMLETMYAAPGVGLAANQVGVLSRMLVLDIDYEEESQDAGKHIVRRNPKILINPTLVYKEGKTSFDEACLSVPHFSSSVVRAEKIKVEYQDIDGLSHVLSADGFLAVVLQHEMDHLEGKLFIDRISSLKKRHYVRTMKKT